MRKIITLLFLVIMSSALIGCGKTNSAKNAIVGEWKTVNGDSWTFNKDGTYGKSGTWGYDKETEKYYYVSKAGLSIYFSIKEEDGVRSIYVMDEAYYHIDDYAKIEEKVEKMKNMTVDEMKTYYDVDKYVGTPKIMCLGCLSKDKDENKITFSRISEGVLGLTTEYNENIKSYKEYFCIIVDNDTPDRDYDDEIAYVFVE